MCRLTSSQPLILSPIPVFSKTLCNWYWLLYVSILTQFPSNRSQYVMVDNCRCTLVNDVLGMPQDSALGPLLYPLYKSEFFSNLENKLIGYADYSSLIAVQLSSVVRVAVAESLDPTMARCGTCHVASTFLPHPRTTTATICSASSLLLLGFTLSHNIRFYCCKRLLGRNNTIYS